MTFDTTNATRRIPRAESIEVLQRYLQEAQCFEVFALPWICLDREIVGFEDPLWNPMKSYEILWREIVDTSILPFSEPWFDRLR